MIPAATMAWGILRELRRMDELQLRIQLEALGFSFAGTAILTFSYGFLEGLGYPRLSMFTVWPILATPWIVGLVLARRRYRRETACANCAPSGWSQAGLGERLGVSRQTVNAIENERYHPSLPLAFLIAKAFALPIEKLFFEDR